MFAFSKMLPALPLPDVATDIFPPSASANVGTGAKAGADTVISPRVPGARRGTEQSTPGSKPPEIETDSVAVTVTASHQPTTARAAFDPRSICLCKVADI